MLFSGNYYQKNPMFLLEQSYDYSYKNIGFYIFILYSTGCKFFKEMSIIGAECVKAPQDT